MRADWSLPLLVTDRWECVPPDDDGLEFIAANMRPADAEEVYATSGQRDLLAALHRCVAASSSAAMVISAYGVPMAVGGVSTLSVIYNTGSPWLLATPEMDRHARALIRYGRAYTASMLGQYERLENHVDVRNRKSVAWLQRLGYRMEAPAPYGAFGLPFHKFSIER